MLAARKGEKLVALPLFFRYLRTCACARTLTHSRIHTFMHYYSDTPTPTFTLTFTPSLTPTLR